MKIQVMSDLHVDLMRLNTFVSAITDADVVVRAGRRYSQRHPGIA